MRNRTSYQSLHIPPQQPTQEVKCQTVYKDKLSAEQIKEFLHESRQFTEGTNFEETAQNSSMIEKIILKQTFLQANSLFDPTDYFGGLNIPDLNVKVQDSRLSDMFKTTPEEIPIKKDLAPRNYNNYNKAMNKMQQEQANNNQLYFFLIFEKVGHSQPGTNPALGTLTNNTFQQSMLLNQTNSTNFSANSTVGQQFQSMNKDFKKTSKSPQKQSSQQKSSQKEKENHNFKGVNSFLKTDSGSKVGSGDDKQVQQKSIQQIYLKQQMEKQSAGLQEQALNNLKNNKSKFTDLKLFPFQADSISTENQHPQNILKNVPFVQQQQPKLNLNSQTQDNQQNQRILTKEAETTIYQNYLKNNDNSLRTLKDNYLGAIQVSRATFNAKPDLTKLNQIQIKRLPATASIQIAPFPQINGDIQSVNSSSGETQETLMNSSLTEFVIPQQNPQRPTSEATAHFFKQGTDQSQLQSTHLNYQTSSGNLRDNDKNCIADSTMLAVFQDFGLSSSNHSVPAFQKYPSKMADSYDKFNKDKENLEMTFSEEPIKMFPKDYSSYNQMSQIQQSYLKVEHMPASSSTTEQPIKTKSKSFAFLSVGQENVSPSAVLVQQQHVPSVNNDDANTAKQYKVIKNVTENAQPSTQLPYFVQQKKSTEKTSKNEDLKSNCRLEGTDCKLRQREQKASSGEHYSYQHERANSKLRAQRIGTSTQSSRERTIPALLSTSRENFSLTSPKTTCNNSPRYTDQRISIHNQSAISQNGCYKSGTVINSANTSQISSYQSQNYQSANTAGQSAQILCNNQNNYLKRPIGRGHQFEYKINLPADSSQNQSKNIIGNSSTSSPTNCKVKSSSISAASNANSQAMRQKKMMHRIEHASINTSKQASFSKDQNTSRGNTSSVSKGTSNSMAKFSSNSLIQAQQNQTLTLATKSGGSVCMQYYIDSKEKDLKQAVAMETRKQALKVDSKYEETLQHLIALKHRNQQQQSSGHKNSNVSTQSGTSVKQTSLMASNCNKDDMIDNPTF